MKPANEQMSCDVTRKREIKKRVDSFCCQNEAFTKLENLMTVLNKERNLLILEKKTLRVGGDNFDIFSYI